MAGLVIYGLHSSNLVFRNTDDEYWIVFLKTDFICAEMLSAACSWAYQPSLAASCEKSHTMMFTFLKPRKYSWKAAGNLSLSDFC